MRRLSSRSARLLACLLITGVLYSLALSLVHTHLGGGYRTDCPACHQERTLGSSTGAVAVVVLTLTPIDLGDVGDFVFLGGPFSLALHLFSPRSPPPAIAA